MSHTSNLSGREVHRLSLQCWEAIKPAVLDHDDPHGLAIAAFANALALMLGHMQEVRDTTADVCALVNGLLAGRGVPHRLVLPD
jgi:hypothetical protein